MYNGALTYSLPLLNVPGQGTGYNITLNYNSDDVKMRLEADFADFKDFTDFDFEIKDPNFTDIGDIGNVYSYVRKENG